MIAEANPDRVRVATERDGDEIMDLCRRNHAENGIGAFAPDKVRAVFRRSFEPGRNDPAIIGIIGGNCIEGSVGLVIDQPWDSETSLLMALWNYVLPEHRATTNMKDLTAFATRLSEPAPVGIGVPLWMGVITTRRTEAQERLYRRHMGAPVASMWLCESTYGGMA